MKEVSKEIRQKRIIEKEQQEIIKIRKSFEGEINSKIKQGIALEEIYAYIKRRKEVSEITGVFTEEYIREMLEYVKTAIQEKRDKGESLKLIYN